MCALSILLPFLLLLALFSYPSSMLSTKSSSCSNLPYASFSCIFAVVVVDDITGEITVYTIYTNIVLVFVGALALLAVFAPKRAGGARITISLVNDGVVCKGGRLKGGVGDSMMRKQKMASSSSMVILVKTELREPDRVANKRVFG